MTKKELMFIDKVVKAMKVIDFVIFKDGIVGSSSDATISTATFATGLNMYDNIEYKLDIWKELIELVMNTDKEYQDYDKFISYYSVKRYNNIPLLSVYGKVLDILKINSTANFFVDDIRRDKEFEDIIQKKSGEGATLYRLTNRYCMYLYKGLLPVNKNDKVDLSIYENPNMPNTFLAQFDINKGFIKISVFGIYMCL